MHATHDRIYKEPRCLLEDLLAAELLSGCEADFFFFYLASDISLCLVFKRACSLERRYKELRAGTTLMGLIMSIFIKTALKFMEALKKIVIA